MFNIFVGFHHFAARRKYFFLTVFLTIILVCGYTISKIQFQEDIRSIIPRDERINDISNAFTHSKYSDQLILTFSLCDTSVTSPDILIKAAECSYKLLKNDSVYIKSIQFKSNSDAFFNVYDFVYNNLPLFLNENDYTEIKKQLEPDNVESTLKSDYMSLTTLMGMVTKDFIFKDPLNITLKSIKRFEKFHLDKNFDLYQDCIFTRDKKHLLFFLNPEYTASNTEKNALLIARLDSVVAETIQFNPGVTIEYYGGTAVAVINAKQVKWDILLTVSVSFVVLIFLSLMILRKLRIVLLIFMPIVIGITIALALMVINGGEMSSIAFGIGAILIGISIDYSLHAFTHFRNSSSVEHFLETLTTPLMSSCITTVSAFLCLLVIRSQVFVQLGFFASLGNFITAIVVLTVFPFFLKSGSDKNTTNIHKVTIFDRFAGYHFEKNKILICFVIVVSILSFYYSGKVRFNSDISSLNYMSDKLRISEKNLKSISSEANSAVYLIVQGKTPEEAIAKAEKNESLFREAKDEKIISDIISPTDIIPSVEEQEKRIKRWNQFWDGVDRDKTKALIIDKSLKFDFSKSAFDDFYQLLDSSFSTKNPKEFAPLTDMFLNNYVNWGDSVNSIITIVKTEKQNKHRLFKKCASNKDIIIFDNQYYTDQFLSVLKDDFNLIIIFSTILAFVILLLFFGRIENAIITFLPIMLSMIWTTGIMGLFGIEFTVFNIIISTFILGLGVDYSIFIMSGLVNNYKTNKKDLTPYKLSVLLSAFTTILCMGVMIFASHPALRSIGLVSVIGLLSVLLISYTVLPLIFSFIVNNKGKQRIVPVTMLNFTFSIFSLLLFVIGTILATIFLTIIRIIPANKLFKKRIVHYIICISSRFIVYINITTRKSYVNKDKLDFSKPVVFISNHQSHLDLVLLLLINPRLIILTNKWVWNSPYFGFLVRYVGFYPAYKGLDYGIDKIEKKVKEGYSVLVFPEGTRSVDGRIGRFHQGAFYLADKLNLDIQPVIIHGAMQSLAKDEFFLKSSVITLTFFDRIKVKPASIETGKTYKDQAKEMTLFYRTEFEKLRLMLETPLFYKRILISQYIYKGPVLEWYMRIKLKLENYYSDFHKLLPRSGNILDIGCGYGFMTYMLHFLSDKRTITGIDYDVRKIDVAANCPAKSDKINFIHTDIFDYDFGPKDAFILSDVLHYFNEEKQKMLIVKCIEKLKHGGVIIIRDGDTKLKKRHLGTRYTEFFSTKTGFNKMGEEKLTFTSSEMIKDLISGFDLNMQIVDNTKLTSNIMYVIRKNNAPENVLLND